MHRPGQTSPQPVAGPHRTLSPPPPWLIRSGGGRKSRQLGQLLPSSTGCPEHLLSWEPLPRRSLHRPRPPSGGIWDAVMPSLRGRHCPWSGPAGAAAETGGALQPGTPLSSVLQFPRRPTRLPQTPNPNPHPCPTRARCSVCSTAGGAKQGGPTGQVFIRKQVSPAVSKSSAPSVPGPQAQGSTHASPGARGAPRPRKCAAVSGAKRCPQTETGCLASAAAAVALGVRYLAAML